MSEYLGDILWIKAVATNNVFMTASSSNVRIRPQICITRTSFLVFTGDAVDCEYQWTCKSFHRALQTWAWQSFVQSRFSGGKWMRTGLMIYIQCLWFEQVIIEKKKNRYFPFLFWKPLACHAAKYCNYLLRFPFLGLEMESSNLWPFTSLMISIHV